MADQSAEFVENCGFELSREYKPPEGYRLLQIGEVVQRGDLLLAVNGEPEPQSEPQPGHLQAMIDSQAETIARLMGEIHDSNMEFSRLERNYAAAVEAAGKENTSLREQLDAATAELQRRHPDHVGRAISTNEWMDQFARDASVSRLQADRNDLAGKVITLREQLQQANDRVSDLEALLPIATACTTAQTMVRDMLGYMRCLVSLNSTTDRSNFCTLLESILEVFDDVECDDDETSEAEQG